MNLRSNEISSKVFSFNDKVFFKTIIETRIILIIEKTHTLLIQKLKIQKIVFEIENKQSQNIFAAYKTKRKKRILLKLKLFEIMY